MHKIKVLVIDDSILMRNVLTKMIQSQEDMTVIGAAPDAFIAKDMIRRLAPDVLTLDVEMPKMDGLEFLGHLMASQPMPVLMVSTLTERGADVTLRALELGAIDFVTKPKIDVHQAIHHYTEEITDKIRIAYSARHRLQKIHAKLVSSPQPTATTHSPTSASSTAPHISISKLIGHERIIMIGASTGGTEAIRVVLQGMPVDCPGILITQHMPAGFTKSFAERLNQLCKIEVKEAQEGDIIKPGHAYIAPGDKHLQIARAGGGYQCRLNDGPAVNRHKPSVEMLFQSGTNVAARHIIAIMLTGMGKDGAKAMLELREAGAHTICQDEASCVVFGMPREAIALGAAHEVTSLQDISRHALQQLAKMNATASGIKATRET